MTTKNKAVAARKTFNRNPYLIQSTLFHRNSKKLQSKYQLLWQLKSPQKHQQASKAPTKRIFSISTIVFLNVALALASRHPCFQTQRFKSHLFWTFSSSGFLRLIFRPSFSTIWILSWNLQKIWPWWLRFHSCMTSCSNLATSVCCSKKWKRNACTRRNSRT